MASADTAALNGSLGANGAGDRLTPAQRAALHQKNSESHKPAIEEVPDEDDTAPRPHPSSSSILEPNDDAPLSAKAAGKRKETVLDAQSEGEFPGLGGASKPIQTPFVKNWGSLATNVAKNGIPTNGASTPISRPTPPTTQPSSKVAAPSLAGQVSGKTFTFQPKELPRTATKKPLPDLLREISKKHRVPLTQTTGEGGVIKITAGGNQTSESLKDPGARERQALKETQAFRELGSQINSKSSQKVPVPRSARASIIGKGGSQIRQLQELSGARIQLPKQEDVPSQPDDDDGTVDILVEGNPIAIRIAEAELSKIAARQGSNMSTRLRAIPPEFYPFIAAAHAEELQDRHNVRLHVPQYHTWTSQRPPKEPQNGDLPVFLPAADENHITLDGERASVHAARAELEALTEALRQQLTLSEVSINRGRHQFIIGDRGIPSQDFLNETGCAIILPGDEYSDSVTIVGPATKIASAAERAYTLASSMSSENFDLTRNLRHVRDSKEHARNFTQYLHDRQQIELIEALHGVHIEAPIDPSGGAEPWQFYSRDNLSGMKAQSEVNNILSAHPPSRIAALPVDDFYHNFLRRNIMPRVKQEYGVHVVIPSLSGAPVLLVFEGEDGNRENYEVPRGQPSAAEVRAFEKGLQDARKHILDIINAQAQITSAAVEAPKIFHEKLKRFITKENKEYQIPARVFPNGNEILLRGPEPVVEDLAAKVGAFVAEAIEDEKERGFTLSFDFPKDHAGQLMGRQGSHIKELREKFDVDIKVGNDGKVDIQGPKAKAENAKSHILSLGRQWADMATYTLKIEPEYHSELIGAKGSNINKLQERYKVQIHFPRARSGRDDQSIADTTSEAGPRSRPEQQPDQVVVKGPKKDADNARDEILSLLQLLKDTSHEAAVSVKAGQIPQLIGQRGAAMDEIRSTTQARIDVPNAKGLSEDEEVVLKIKGTKEQVAAAKKLIEEKRKVYNETVRRTLLVDKKHHGVLIGPGGATIREIVKAAGGSENQREIVRTVQFPKAEADGNEIKFEGNQDVVQKIIAEIQQRVKSIESQETEEVEVPVDKHRSLIGRGGETKKELEGKFKVNLDIPRQGSGQTAVKITGQPEHVAKAKQHIQGLTKERQGETVQIPRKAHHSVADGGQFFKTLRSQHKVTVDHGGHKIPPKPSPPQRAQSNGASMPTILDDPSEAADAHIWQTVDLNDSELDGEIPWVLYGDSEAVAKAKKLLDERLVQALQNSSIGYLWLPDPSTYRFVVGPGGRKVDNIRKVTGSKITVPKPSSNDDPIEVIGSADGIEATRDLILKAVREGGNARS